MNTVKRGDWVLTKSDPTPGREGIVKRVAADGSWADVNWGAWTKRMPTSSLQVVVTLSLPGGWEVTDVTRQQELAAQAVEVAR